MAMRQYRIVGPGRAGLSLDIALQSVGWSSAGVWGPQDNVTHAAEEVDLVVLAVPDDLIGIVAQAVRPGQAVVMHLAGSRTLSVLDPHVATASAHPLISLPDPSTGAQRLLGNCQFAVAGDEIAGEMVRALGGTAIAVDENSRAAYHAGASVAGNHAVALWAQVERIANLAGVPARIYWQLMRTSLENAVETSAREAITGPAARGDWDTCRSHIEAIGGQETDLYLALAVEAAALADKTFPENLS